MGSRATVMVAQIVGLLCQGLLWVLTTPNGGCRRGDVAILLGAGASPGSPTFTAYRGLELGPVALVSPIASAFAAVAVLLAVVLLGESLGPILLSEVCSRSSASCSRRRTCADSRWRRSGIGRGLPHAFAAMVGFGVAAFVSGYREGLAGSRRLSRVRLGDPHHGRHARDAGPGREQVRRISPRNLGIAAAAGVTDIIGVVAYS